MKARYWSVAIVLFLVNYLIFASLFTELVDPKFGSGFATRTPVPTFTPAPALPPAIIIPTLTPVPPVPTPTATRVLQAPDTNPSNNAALVEGSPPEGVSAAAQSGVESELLAPGTVNIRSGPGVNYPVIGALNANTPVRIVGRNADTSWWQIEITPGSIGWVASSVVSANNADGVPVTEASAAPAAAPAAAAPQPAADTPPPAEPPKPKYQYEPTGWYDDGNAGLTRFLGTITDVNGNPVNGVFVRVSCGDYSTISFPSGPVGWGPLNESADWPPGFYDVTVDTKPVPCIWVLSVVETDDRKTVKAVLSEEIPVEITLKKSIVTANWRKNW
jgi:hypothetical protein